MAKALIFATTFMTKGNIPIAKYISKNAKTDIFNLKDLMTLNLDAYDTIIFGTANNSGRADKLVEEFVQKNTDVLAKKKKYLYVLVSKDDEKNAEQAAQIAQDLEVEASNAFYIPKKAEEMNESGFPAEVDSFISRLG
ncbi:MAG: hypothetical protein IKP04_00230 [Candidatus Methanomethylophilaceae archaeon]|nr:hypothetical protein [Candidatus Methanomethylophilaceae archaeon]